MATVKGVPEGYHTITPHLTIRGAAEAIEFYKKAFGARELTRMPGPGGKIMHAEIQIGDSRVLLHDEFPEMGAKGPQSLGGSPVTLNLFVPDVDAVFAQATKAGAATKMPPADMFWGDRYSQVTDPYGHHWAIATRKKEMTYDEMKKAGEAAMAQMGKP